MSTLRHKLSKFHPALGMSNSKLRTGKWSEIGRPSRIERTVKTLPSILESTPPDVLEALLLTSFHRYLCRSVVQQVMGQASLQTSGISYQLSMRMYQLQKDWDYDKRFSFELLDAEIEKFELKGVFFDVLDEMVDKLKEEYDHE